MNFHTPYLLPRMRAGIALFTLLLAAVLLAACFSAGPAPAGANQTQQPQPSVSPRPQNTPARTPTIQPSPTLALPPGLQVDPADLRGVKVTLWQPFVGEMGGLLQRMAEEFNQKNEWGIRAAVVAQGSDGVLAEGINRPGTLGLPQAVLAPSAQLNAWLLADRLAPLDPYLAYPLTRLDPKVQDAFSPVFWDQDRLAGRQAGIPALRTAYGLLYNRTWAAELGFTSPPLTPAQFRTQACEAAKENNRSPFLEKRGTGGWLVSTDPEVTYAWLTAFGLEAVPAEEGQAYHFAQQAGEDALSFLRSMQEDGCLWVGKDPSALQYFSERYALFTSVSLQDLSAEAKLLASVQNPDDWMLIAYPSAAGSPFANAQGYSYGVVKGSAQDQMAAWLFIRWLSLPENLARLGALYPSLPVSASWQDQPAAAPTAFPWTLILPLEKTRILPMPSLPGWLVARRPLEDAGWQLYNLASRDQIPEILPQLDALIRDLLTP